MSRIPEEIGKRVAFQFSGKQVGTILRSANDFDYEVEYIDGLTGLPATIILRFDRLKPVGTSLREIYETHKLSFPFFVRGHIMWWAVTDKGVIENNADYLVMEWKEDK